MVAAVLQRYIKIPVLHQRSAKRSYCELAFITFKGLNFSDLFVMKSYRLQ